MKDLAALDAQFHGGDDQGRTTGYGVEGAGTAILLGHRGRGPTQRVYLGCRVANPADRTGWRMAETARH